MRRYLTTEETYLLIKKEREKLMIVFFFLLIIGSELVAIYNYALVSYLHTTHRCRIHSCIDFYSREEGNSNSMTSNTINASNTAPSTHVNDVTTIKADASSTSVSHVCVLMWACCHV